MNSLGKTDRKIHSVAALFHQKKHLSRPKHAHAAAAAEL